MNLEVVHGPPGAGKTTYVKEHKRDDEIIIDLDMLYVALSGNPLYDKPSCLFDFVDDVAQYALRSSSRHARVAKVWLVSARPDLSVVARQVEEWAKLPGWEVRVTYLDPGMPECLRRIGKDANRSAHIAGWEKILTKWYARKEESKYVRRTET